MSSIDTTNLSAGFQTQPSMMIIEKYYSMSEIFEILRIPTSESAAKRINEVEESCRGYRKFHTRAVKIAVAVDPGNPNSPLEARTCYEETTVYPFSAEIVTLILGFVND